MSIQSFVHDALNALKGIATDGTVDAELRINAAEKILDYAAKQNSDAGDHTTTEAIGFDLSLTSVDADAVYEQMRKYGKNLSEALKSS